MGGRLRILMPSIVDAGVRRGGAWTVTRGLVELFRRDPWNAELVSLVPPEPRFRRLRQAACLVSANWSGMPARVRFVHSRAFRKQVRESVEQERFDLLVINGSDLLWCLADAPPQMRTLAVVHNREADLFADQVKATIPRVPLLHRLLRAESDRLQQFEIDGLRRADAAIFVSTADAAACAEQVPGLLHLVLQPLFTDPPQRIAKEPSATLDLGILANFQWWPNRDGVGWFVREVLDRLPGDVRLHLFGRGGETVAAAHPRIVGHGFVDDLCDVWRRCDRMLIPTRYGSGVSVKTAESLYHGMPILSTRFGLRGLPPIAHPQIVVRDGAKEWVSFLSSPQARAPGDERLPLDVSSHFALVANGARFDQFLARLLAPG